MQVQILAEPLVVFFSFFFFVFFLSSYFFPLACFCLFSLLALFSFARFLRQRILVKGFFCPKQVQRFKPSAAHLYPNIGQLVIADTTAAPTLSVVGQ